MCPCKQWILQFWGNYNQPGFWSNCIKILHVNKNGNRLKSMAKDCEYTQRSTCFVFYFGPLLEKKTNRQFKTEYNFSYLIPEPSKPDLRLPSFQTSHCSFLSLFSPPQTSHFYLYHLDTGSTHPIPALLSVEWAGWPGNTKNRNSSSYESFLLPAIYIIRTRERKKHREKERQKWLDVTSALVPPSEGAARTHWPTPARACRHRAHHRHTIAVLIAV